MRKEFISRAVIRRKEKEIYVSWGMAAPAAAAAL
jgi:hypothetical protein